MNKVILGFIIGSLLGLIFVQLYFLNIGLQLEKQKSDAKIKRVLRELQREFEKDNEISNQLIDVFQDADNYFIAKPDSLPLIVEVNMESLLREKFKSVDMDVEFLFAITDKENKKVFITNNRTNQTDLKFSKSKISLGTRVGWGCKCRHYLHVQVKDLYGYLLRQLAFLIIPSILFLLSLIACLLFLAYTLNKQKKLHQVKNDFINNLTHELKTPVFSISLASKVLRENLKHNNIEKSAGYLDLIDKENLKLKTHIDKVLELASLESGKYNLQKERADIHELINNVLDGFDLKLNAINAKLNTQLLATTTILNIDKTHFKNVIQNLIENSIKYKDDLLQLEVSTHNDEDNIYIVIKDNGIGIPLEEQKHVFDKFYRVSTGDLHNIKGFGLGLSYVKRIIEAHDASITLKSQAKQGTAFTISLPLKQVA